MEWSHKVPLKGLNTFGIAADAEVFVALRSLGELPEIAACAKPIRVLGGGSNILLTQDVPGVLIHNRLSGIAVVREDDTYTWIEAGAGEQWHNLVMQTVALGLGGMENLALIPGTVGAAPIQNIGAYGAEAKDIIESVNCYHWRDRHLVTLSNEDCKFGYRDSIFKQQPDHSLLVTSVVFRLRKKPVYQTNYGDIERTMSEMGVKEPTVKAIADAVISIRSSKLPDPKEIGNAGSFFKNPTISAAAFGQLQSIFPLIPGYPAPDNTVKVPAGWLIEQAGWKGKRIGNVGGHAKQALVLCNYGNATGQEIFDLSSSIVESVQVKFAIELEREVQIW